VELLLRELARLLRAGISLDQALETISVTTEGSGLGTTSAQLADDVRGGKALSEAMRSYGEPFDIVTVTLVEAAEAAGALTEVFERTAESMKRSKQLRTSVQTAMVYPAMLLLVSVTAVILLLITVVPEFEGILSDNDAGLPWSTVLIFDTSAFLRSNGIVLVAGLAASVFGLTTLMQRPSFRAGLAELSEKLPILGGLLQKAAAARLCRSLGVLLVNRIKLLSALQTLAGTGSTKAQTDRILETAQSLEAGESFGDAVASSGMLPVLATRMVTIGEKSGQLGQMLVDVAQIYEEDVQDGFKRLVTLLEPLLILTLGFVIGGIIVSILTAIMTVNTIVGA
ncbi:MAG: type II secretion system F family protein, partial [Pseudomonadota bacterium]